MTSATIATSPLTSAQRVEARAAYERDGFFLAPKVLPDELLQRASTRMDAVLAGEYETGVPPVGRNFSPGLGLDKLQKIDNAHLSDRTIHEAISHPAIGAWAAALTGASLVQVLGIQMLVKPPGTADAVNVGWHQDLEYWAQHLEGELFTAWLAISEVTADSGPMRFVAGSHEWGLLDAGDFWSGQMDATKARMQGKHGTGSWHEVPGVLPPGAVSFHHCLTVHGSGANRENWPRKSFAIHLRTEKSGFKAGVTHHDVGWLNDWDDEHTSPVIYRSEA